MKCLIVLEKSKTGYSAYSPDVDGCVATAKTRAAVKKRMLSALKAHLAMMKEEGYPLPKPSSDAVMVEVAA